jgi:diacylglycerol kinase family enzyme
VTHQEGVVSFWAAGGRVAIVHDPNRARAACQIETAILGWPGTNGLRVDRHEGRGPDGIQDQTRKVLAEGADALVVGGGDGTFLRILDSIHHPGPPLLVAPLGTSNDYACALGLGRLDEAVQALLHGHVLSADLGRCTFTRPEGGTETRAFASSAGVGFVAAMVRWEAHTAIRLLRKVVRDLIYLPLIVGQTARFRSADLRMEVNEVVVEGTVALLELAKVPSTGGFSLSPGASPASGRFDVCFAQGMSGWAMNGYLLDVLRGRHEKRPDTQIFDGRPDGNRGGVVGVRRVHIETDPPLPLHLHGEFQGFTPATFELLPGCLRVFSPRGVA